MDRAGCSTEQRLPSPDAAAAAGDTSSRRSAVANSRCAPPPRPSMACCAGAASSRMLPPRPDISDMLESVRLQAEEGEEEEQGCAEAVARLSVGGAAPAAAWRTAALGCRNPVRQSHTHAPGLAQRLALDRARQRGVPLLRLLARIERELEGVAAAAAGRVALPDDGEAIHFDDVVAAWLGWSIEGRERDLHGEATVLTRPSAATVAAQESRLSSARTAGDRHERAGALVPQVVALLLHLCQAKESAHHGGCVQSAATGGGRGTTAAAESARTSHRCSCCPLKAHLADGRVPANRPHLGGAVVCSSEAWGRLQEQ